MERHPISLLYKVDSLGNRTLINCVHPHYEAIFFKDSTNTINLNISQKMYYFEFEQNLNKPIKLKGCFLYKRLPVIVFEEHNISDDYLFESLETQVPDSLIYDFEKCNGQNMHNRNNNIENFKMKSK